MTKIFANCITPTKRECYGKAETLGGKGFRPTLGVLSREFLDNEAITEQIGETDILRNIKSHRLPWRNQWKGKKINDFTTLHFITDPDVEER